jgi:hypothetical protein
MSCVQPAAFDIRSREQTADIVDRHEPPEV